MGIRGEGKKVHLIQDIMQVVLHILNPYWDSLNQYFHLSGIHILIIMILSLHLVYFLFLWKPKVLEKLEE